MMYKTRLLTLLLLPLLVLLHGCTKPADSELSLANVSTPDGVILGQPMRVQVNGTGLQGKVVATLRGADGNAACTNFSPTTNSDNLLEYTCDSLQIEGTLTLTLTRIDGVELQTQTLTSTTAGISVTGVTVLGQPNLLMGQANTIRITGTNLSSKTPLTVSIVEPVDPNIPDQGVSKIDACTDLAVIKQSPTELDYRCTPVKVAAVAQALVKLNNDELLEQTLTISEAAALTAITVTPSPLVSGSTITIKLAGTNLTSAVNLTALTADDGAAACDTLTLTTGTASERMYTCLLKATEPFAITATLRALTLSQTVTPTNNFTVTSISALPNERLQIGQPTRFEMLGTGLSKALLPISSQCTNIAYVSGDASKTVFDCTSITNTTSKVTLAMRANNANVYSRDFLLSLATNAVSALNYYGLTYGSNSAVKITSPLLENPDYNAPGALVVKLLGCKTELATRVYTHPGNYDHVFRCDQVNAKTQLNVKVETSSGQVLYQGQVPVNSSSEASAISKAATVSAAVYSNGLITISGTGLDQPIDLALTGCLALDVALRSPTQILARCARFTALGPQTLTVKSNAATLISQSVNILPPQVTFTISHVDNPAVQNATVVIEMEVLNAPISAHNILYYLWRGAYANTVFHRVIPGKVVQGGGFKQGSSTEIIAQFPPIKLERTAVTGLSNTDGTVAMARTNVLDSGTQQFFFNSTANLQYNTNDNNNYAVFARVISGLDILQLLDDVPANSALRPLKDINLLSIVQTQ